MSSKMVDTGRALFTHRIATAELEALAANPSLKVLQTWGPVDPSFWPALDAEFFARRPDVELRLFGFYSEPCDLSFASRLQHVRRLAADDLMQASGVEHVVRIPGLESLSLGIFSLESFEFLREANPGLRSLALGPTRSKKPSLAPLSRFTDLRELHVEGHRKDIGVLSGLRALESVTLRSVTTPDVAFLRPLDRLWSLDLKLGGTKDLSALAGMAGIKFLELWQILGVEDVGVIARLPGLQFVFLQSLPRVEALPDLREARSLRRVMLENMRGLRSLASLEHAPALEELLLFDAGHLRPQDLVPVLRNPSLKRAAVFFGSDRKNREARDLLAQRGIGECRRDGFAFR